MESNYWGTIETLLVFSAVLLTVGFSLVTQAIFGERWGKSYGVSGTSFVAAGAASMLAAVWISV